MNEFLLRLNLRWADFLDIILVAVGIYWTLRLIRGTRALYMLLAFGGIFLLYWLSSLLGLDTVQWLLSHFLGSLLLVVVIVFQNDIRRLLTQFGRSPLFSSFMPSKEAETIEELVKTSVSLANKKIGALFVLERDANVLNYVEMGVPLDGLVSKELLTSIFLPTAPLHDGAIVIQKGRIVAAGCFLPLTINPNVGAEVGTRHRAALGLSEETDAVIVVISEEKGWISVVVEGKIAKGLDGTALRKMLQSYFRPQPTPLRRMVRQWFEPRPDRA